MMMPDSSPSASSTAVAKNAWDTLQYVSYPRLHTSWTLWHTKTSPMGEIEANATSSSIPVSYQVAIALDAFILFITFAVLILLAFYIRKQLVLRRLLSHSSDVEMKGETQSPNASNATAGNSNTIGRRNTLGKFTRKKGHVRWTSSVEQCSEMGSGEKGERERVKMKLGSGEWETDTWGPSTKKGPGGGADGESMGVGMRGGGNAKSGFRFNPLGRRKSSTGAGEWQRGSLWKDVEARRELKKARATKVQARADAGYDGYRGN